MDYAEPGWANRPNARDDARYDARDESNDEAGEAERSEEDEAGEAERSEEDEADALGAFEGLTLRDTKALEALEALGEMSIHCPETAFDELVRTLSALDENEPGSVEKAAELAAEYDRCIGDLSMFQRAMVRVAASTAGPETRRLAARAGFRSIARAVLRIRDKKKREDRTLKLKLNAESKLSKQKQRQRQTQRQREKRNQKLKPNPNNGR
jgi:hypothetical protein